MKREYDYCSGRILNRFSADTASLDDVLPDNVYFFTDAVLSVLSALLAIAIATKGTFLLLLLPLLIIFFNVAKYYRSVNTALAR